MTYEVYKIKIIIHYQLILESNINLNEYENIIIIIIEFKIKFLIH